MSNCVCCSGKLLRHIRDGRVYWFCSHCWEEMPELAQLIAVRQSKANGFKQLIEQSA